MFRRGFESLSEIVGSASAEGRQHLGDLFASSVPTSVKRHEVFRSSTEDGIRLPNVVIPEMFNVEDIFVDVATYYSTQSPITAFVHVLDREAADYFHQWESGVKTNVQPEISGRTRMATLGAMLGETYLTAVTNAEGVAIPSYSACKRSLSYALSRARELYPFCRVSYVVDRWTRLRAMTGLSVVGHAVNSVKLLHELMEDLASRTMTPLLPPGLQDAVCDYLAGRLDEREMNGALLRMYPNTEPFLSSLTGPYDGRMNAFTRIVSAMQATSQGSTADEIVIGYLCNQIHPGSFAHAKVLAKLADFFPSALVWYGVFSVTTKAFSLSEFNFGLLAKISRDISSHFDFHERPTCDISLDELDVLARLPLKPEMIKPAQQKIVAVGLLPGVDVFSRFAIDDAPVADLERARDSDRGIKIADELNARVSSLLEEAMLLLNDGRSSLGRTFSGGGKRVRKSK